MTDSRALTIVALTTADFDEAILLWEASVRASHHFLSEQDIEFLRPLVREQALPALTLRGIRDPLGKLLGFLGVAGIATEALFVLPEAMGKGIGRKLMRHAETEFATTRVDVNEDNHEALNFYRHLGYEIAGRSALDGQGRPFPILHLERTG